MCEMLDRMINKGKMEGISEGINEGKNQMILKMYQNNFTLQQIAMVAEKTVDEVNAIIKEHTLSPS